MLYFTKLFTKPPFRLLKLHMEKVMACIAKLDEILKVFEKETISNIDELAKKVSEYEHEADLVKNEIRSSLPSPVLFPIDRSHFLEIVAMQDNLADVAEDVANHLMIKELTVIPEIQKDLIAYKNKIMESAWVAKDIIFKLDELVESSFGGGPALQAKDKIDETAYLEHEVDVMRGNLIKKVFQVADKLSTPDFYLWMRIIEDLALMAHFSEKLALRIGMVLDIK